MASGQGKPGGWLSFLPLTIWGAREIGLSLALLLVLAAAFGWLALAFHPALALLVLLPLLVFGWVLWFFRHPHRVVPPGEFLLVSPADGVVTHLDQAEEPDFIGGPAWRCSIFLSIFNVHLNRAPLAGRVEYLRFRPGAFFDARREESLTKNQNQDVGLLPLETGAPARVLVRQSTGAIARRIVCPLAVGETLARGECYGMIKFGSRTTLFLPREGGVEWRVATGDRVKAGETVLAVFNRPPRPE
ncbi:MAG: phosphatidylserine decarboxylase [Planctomycetota bacterium]|nr:phosphatidylserine decarboxylase [Planctomycetota bacterium]